LVAGTGIAGPAPREVDSPAALLFHADRLWVADLGNHRILAITLPNDARRLIYKGFLANFSIYLRNAAQKVGGRAIITAGFGNFSNSKVPLQVCALSS